MFEKVSALCLALPGTKLTMTWGSPHFRVGEKIFCGFGKHGRVSMSLAERQSWQEVAALIRESYELIAPKARLAKLR